VNEAVFWWLRYLSIFALNSPFGLPVRFTIGVSAYEGERVAAILRKKPYDVVDAYGRPCKQVQTDDKLIAFEWLIPIPDDGRGGPTNAWGTIPEYPKRETD
jgi:hypothetical protein